MEKEELEQFIRNIIRDELKNNVNIGVDGYYEPYSGQQEHYHEVNIWFNEE